MKILFATDGSTCSTHAILKARHLLPLDQAEIYVVGVVDTTPLMVGYEGPGAGAVVLLDKIQADVKANLARAVEIFQDDGLTATALQREGEPAAQIVATAKELDADLVVLGSHGRNAVGRLILGSVSDAVLHHWHGTTLVVRPEA